MAMIDLLKLRATDAEDMQVISAVLQDSIVPVCDMVFQPEDKSFVMVAQRLRHESAAIAPERICCAVRLRGVENAQTLGLDLTQADRMLDLLAAILDGGQVTLIFAGEAQIRLKLGDWTLTLQDFGETWPAHCAPCHDSAPSAAS